MSKGTTDAGCSLHAHFAGSSGGEGFGGKTTPEHEEGTLASRGEGSESEWHAGVGHAGEGHEEEGHAGEAQAEEA